MQNDLIFRTLVGLSYPLIYRHDRSLYESRPQLDPIQLMRNAFLASFAGYWIGKFYKGRQNLFSLVFPIPLFAKYFYDEWAQSDSIKKYQEFRLQSSIFQQQRKKGVGVLQKPSSNKLKETKHRIIRKMPRLQTKIYNAQSFMSQLQKDYFQ